jgi:hypothetical protein
MRVKDRIFYLIVTLMLMVTAALGSIAMMAPADEAQAQYNTACYEEFGGAKRVGGSGCEYEFQSGSTVDAQSGSTVDLAGNVDFTGATITGLSYYFVTEDDGNTLVTGTLYVSDTAVFTSAATALAGFDLNGTELTLDADADTSITADTDDQIDIEINGADDFAFKANSLELASGSIVDLNASADALALDTDGNTSISAPTDNQIDIEVNGADDFQITANTLTALSGSSIKADTIAETTENNGVAVDGVTLKDGGATLGAAGVLDVPVNVEHIGVPTVLTVSISYTPTTGTLATIGDGEIWFVHSVFIETNTNFDCTGNDCALTIGDGNDADGFIAANDAALQAAFTEATGYAAGWYGIENGSGGAYTLDDGGPFIYAPDGADETIDYEVAGTDPAAGEATVWIIYTRVQ